MYYVTGVSRGLGKAIAELLLSQNYFVTGIGRNNSIEHSNFTFVECDLSNPASIKQLDLDIDQDECVLINNAGMIGEIDRYSFSHDDLLQQVLQVNTVAPMELAKCIYRQLTNKGKFKLVNISSGAANRAIPSWAAYCASKAALNMMTEAFYLEEQELGHSPKVYSVAPGVIDTAMQEQIRNTSKSQFSAVENFKKMNEDGQLFSAKEAATLLLKLINGSFDGQIFHDLRQV